jgi:hypothetical protein
MRNSTREGMQNNRNHNIMRDCQIVIHSLDKAGFHDSSTGLCVTQFAGLLVAHPIARPFPSLPHAFATRV